ncbi:MAG: hypothetical protein WAP56_03235 [Acetivibrionales bacterium]|jgi:hypothetical protein|nr:hypothetical protein [Bacillota bacterium]NLP06652.1 hypothetical protein [Clostridiaceae bacterium]HOA55401.1 hypothetical protein [Clostridiales bacterium]HQD31537.1 hypothetical protein [Clostridiales bacterium]
MEMVILLVVIVAAVSAFEIAGMARKKQTREIIIFIVLALFTLAMGIYYILAPHDKSLIYYAFKFLGLDL